MPSIAVDARMWRHAGIGRYIRETASAMLRLGSGHRFSFIGPPEAEPFFMNAGAAAFRADSSKIYGLKEQWTVARAAGDADLLHVPHFNIPLGIRKRLAVTVHDLIYLHGGPASPSAAARAYCAFFMKFVETKAAVVFTVSEYTKKDILRRFPKIDARKILVTPEAAGPAFRRIDVPGLESVKSRHSLSRPFVLYVGSLKPHKNVPLLIEAMGRLRAEGKIDHDLILVGNRAGADRDSERALATHAFARHLGALPDEDLAAVYNLADLFVLPSSMEGFGLPVLEAMACGTPVLTSDAGSLPEVGGDAAVIFPAGQIDALCELLYNVLKNNDLRKKRSAAGLERVKGYSWSRTASLTLEGYAMGLNASL